MFRQNTYFEPNLSERILEGNFTPRPRLVCEVMDIVQNPQGIEDYMGDMDFKLAGSRQGITALQVMPSSPRHINYLPYNSTNEDMSPP